MTSIAPSNLQLLCGFRGRRVNDQSQKQFQFQHPPPNRCLFVLAFVFLDMEENANAVASWEPGAGMARAPPNL